MVNRSSLGLLDRFIHHPLFPSRESVYVRWYPKLLSPPPSMEELARDQPSPRGIYIHVPFCDRLCRFCPFNKRVSDIELIQQFVRSLVREITLWAQLCVRREPLKYVYFGGGTPSVLSPRDLEFILRTVADAFGMNEYTEVTLESHPTHINPSFLSQMRSAGVTRFSTGLQSFYGRRLAAMGAQHDEDDVRRVLSAAEGNGETMAIDLLFRCEGQSVADWRLELSQAVEAQFEHVSCYSLVLKSDERQPSTIVEAEMTVAIEDILGNAGLSHYASCASGGFDYCTPRARCKYEEDHWHAPQDEFLGLGPGAFGFVANRTTVNGLDLKSYCSLVERGRLPLVSGTLATPEEMRRRYFVLGVKTLEVPLAPYRACFGEEPLERFNDEFRRLSELSLAIIEDDVLKLSPVGCLFVDSVSEFFFSPAQLDVPHPEEPEIRRMEVYGRVDNVQ